MMFDVSVRTAPDQVWEKQPVADAATESPVRCSQAIDIERGEQGSRHSLPHEDGIFPSVASNVGPYARSLRKIRSFPAETACGSSSLPVKISRMRQRSSWPVIPAEAGIHFNHETPWIPASAGMTDFLGACSRFDRRNNGSSDLRNNRGFPRYWDGSELPSLHCRAFADPSTDAPFPGVPARGVLAGNPCRARACDGVSFLITHKDQGMVFQLVIPCHPRESGEKAGIHELS